MNHASGKDYDPSAWAKQRQQRIKRALQVRQKRQSGSPDKNHTFKPQLVAATAGASSKLPVGARVGDGAAPTRGAYDLSALDSMEDVFPPKRTSTNIYRDRRYEDDGHDGGGVVVAETRDSLDRLAGSTSGRRRLSRVASASSTGSASPPPLPLPAKASTHDTGHSNGYGHDKSQHPEWKPHSYFRQKGEGEPRRAPISAGDALSHEVDQRPHVRGSPGEAPPGWRERDATATTDGSSRQACLVRGAGGDSRDSRGNSSGGGGGGEPARRGGGGGGGGGGEVAPETADDEAFLSSLRGRGGGVSAGKRAGGGGGGGASRQPGRRQARRPEWNSDTVPAAASLGGREAAVFTVNSQAAVQERRESRRRNAADDAVAVDSPYATGGRGGGAGGDGGGGVGGGGGGGGGGVSDGSNTAWKHKHTRTFPWGQEGLSATVSGGGGGGSGGGSGGRGGMGVESVGGLGRTGNGAPPRRGRAERAAGREGAGGAREGYRLQMMPDPSNGSFNEHRADEDYFSDGSGGDRNQSAEGEPPVQKEHVRRNLSLLKKKIHSQAGSRRSQSAGPRASELFGDPDSPTGTGYADPHQTGRQHLHMTTGTAPAMMPSKPGAFLRDGGAGGLGGLGRRGAGRAPVPVPVRPPPEGPGSPYAIDPNPRGAASRANPRPRQHITTHITTQQQQQQQQHHHHPTAQQQQQQQQQQQLQRHQPPTQQQQQQRQDSTTFSNGGRPRHGQGHRGAAARGDTSTRHQHAPLMEHNGIQNQDQQPPEEQEQEQQQEYEEEEEPPGRVGSGRGRTAAARAHGRGRSHLEGTKGGGAQRSRLRVGRALSGDTDGICGGQFKSPDRRRAWESERGSGEGFRGRGGGGGGGGGGFAEELPDDAFPDEQVVLEECRMCGRRFKPEALERHSRVCQTVFQAKRKVFNASEMRIKGTELEKFAAKKGNASGTRERAGRGRGQSQAQAPPRTFDETPVGRGGGAKASKWRQQSSQFREALRQARIVTDAQKSGKSLAALPPPKPSAPDPSLVPCPHCGRRFNETAGERHMQHCKNIKAKPSVLKKGSGSLLGHAARKTSGLSGARGQRW